MKNIEEFLHPNNGKLIIDDGIIKSTIVDCELDEYECIFNGEEDIQIDTEGYTHITLDIQILEKIIQLIKKADKMYEKI